MAQTKRAHYNHLYRKYERICTWSDNLGFVSGSERVNLPLGIEGSGEVVSSGKVVSSGEVVSSGKVVSGCLCVVTEMVVGDSFGVAIGCLCDMTGMCSSVAVLGAYKEVEVTLGEGNSVLADVSSSVVAIVGISGSSSV